MNARAITLAALCLTGCVRAQAFSDLRTELLESQTNVALCHRRESELLAMLEPTVTVRVARPDELDRALSTSSAAALRRRAVLVHIETSTSVVEDEDARVDVGFEVHGRPSRLVLPVDYAIAEFTEVGGAPRPQEAAVATSDLRVTPLPGALQSFADGVRVGYATFIIPFVLVTALAGRELPTIEQGHASLPPTIATHSRSEWAFLGSVLERGGCQLIAGGGCRRWFVVPRPEDEARAPIALTFAVRVAGGQHAVLSVALPADAEASTIEQRIRRRFANNTPIVLSRLEGVRYTSICDRRAR
ncbi:MAG: hypothetical protein JNK05_19575 [Myxococcales bacterium]|nr:hypothetical protein [Myxococcales bacterium]